MNVRGFLESQPREGTKVIIHTSAVVNKFGDLEAADDYYSLGIADDPGLDLEVTIPKPELPTKFGAVIDHSKYGKCVLASPESDEEWRGPGLRAIWRSSETLTVTGTFTILSEGVDE